jgi:hypothetical protein
MAKSHGHLHGVNVNARASEQTSDIYPVRPEHRIMYGALLADFTIINLVLWYWEFALFALAMTAHSFVCVWDVARKRKRHSDDCIERSGSA